MIRRVVPELMVENLRESVRWYEEVLGLEAVEQEDGFAKLRAGEAEILLYERQEFAREIQDFAKAEIGGTQVLYLEVDGLKDLYEKIKGKAEVVKELWETPYGSREAIIKDHNGYYLLLGERG